MQPGVVLNHAQDVADIYEREFHTLRSLTPFLGYGVPPREQYHSYMDSTTLMSDI